MGFREDHVWGVATASYQIEGASGPTDRGRNVWDMLCDKPGAIFEGHSGAEACDHVHRYQEDVALMKQLGVGAYRFSVAWPRVMPDGLTLNPTGLDFYDRLVDEIVGAGIDPWATLFHWDYPLDLYHRGGWLNPDSPKWFADYAQAVVDRIGDRVGHWFTQNEPQCFLGLGLWDGIHAPGDHLRWAEVLLAGHHSMLGHGMATQVIRSRAKRSPKVGFAPVGITAVPATESRHDIDAARQFMFACDKITPWQNAWWMEPVLNGRYPDDGIKLYAGAVPKFSDDEMKLIAQPMDFFGANIYHAHVIRQGDDGRPEEVKHSTGAPMTAFRWWVEPLCLYWGPKFFYERYGLPIVISENGLSNQDWVHLDGAVHDPQRIDFLHRHLLQLKRAQDEGVPIAGYFQWSLLDNFEWAEGYKERFGLVFVDYPTQQRIPKDSFEWYRQVIAANGDNL
jgi:beta-glucosidase